MQTALPEPTAASLLMLGYLCLLRGRSACAGLLFAVSLLVRETGSVFVMSVCIGVFLAGHRRQGVRLALLSLAPLVVWRLYVAWVLAPDWGGQALWFNPHNVGTPFAGIVDLWRTILSGHYFGGSADLGRAGLWYSIVLIGGLVIAVTLAIARPSAVTIAAALYGLLGVSLTYDSIWVHVGNGQRGTYELFTMLAWASVAPWTYPRLVQRAIMMFWLATAGYVFFGSFDADFIRNTVFAPFS